MLLLIYFLNWVNETSNWSHKMQLKKYPKPFKSLKESSLQLYEIIFSFSKHLPLIMVLVNYFKK